MGIMPAWTMIKSQNLKKKLSTIIQIQHNILKLTTLYRLFFVLRGISTLFMTTNVFMATK